MTITCLASLAAVRVVGAKVVLSVGSVENCVVIPRAPSTYAMDVEKVLIAAVAERFARRQALSSS
jgi:hypothetical protein